MAEVLHDVRADISVADHATGTLKSIAASTQRMSSSFMQAYRAVGAAREAYENIGQVTSKASAGVDHFTRKMSGLGGILSLTALGYGVKRMFDSAQQQLMTIKQIRDETGAAAEDIDGLIDHFDKVGLSGEQLSNIILRMSRRTQAMAMANRAGAGATGAAFKKLGVDINKGPVEAFKQLAEKAKAGKINAAALSQAYGIPTQSAARLMDVLREGGGALQNTIDDLKKRGLLVNDGDIKLATNYRDTLASISSRWDRIKTIVVVSLLPSVLKALNWIDRNLDRWMDKAKYWSRQLGAFATQHAKSLALIGKLLLAQTASVKLTGRGLGEWVGTFIRLSGQLMKMLLIRSLFVKFFGHGIIGSGLRLGGAAMGGLGSAASYLKNAAGKQVDAAGHLLGSSKALRETLSGIGSSVAAGASQGWMWMGPGRAGRRILPTQLVAPRGEKILETTLVRGGARRAAGRVGQVALLAGGPRAGILGRIFGWLPRLLRPLLPLVRPLLGLVTKFSLIATVVLFVIYVLKTLWVRFHALKAAGGDFAERVARIRAIISILLAPLSWLWKGVVKVYNIVKDFIGSSMADWADYWLKEIVYWVERALFGTLVWFNFLAIKVERFKAAFGMGGGVDNTWKNIGDTSDKVFKGFNQILDVILLITGLKGFAYLAGKATKQPKEGPTKVTGHVASMMIDPSAWNLMKNVAGFVSSRTEGLRKTPDMQEANRRAEAQVNKMLSNTRTPTDRVNVNNDFRGSHFQINQHFEEGFEPDRIALAFANDVSRLGERKLQSGFAPLFGVR